MFNALVHVRLDDLIAKRLQRTPRRDRLRQYVGAIGVTFNHALNGFDLAAYFPQPRDERLLLLLWMDVFHARGLTTSARPAPFLSN